MKIKTRYIVLCGILLIIGVFAFGYFKGKAKERENSKKTEQALNKEIERQTAIINDRLTYIATMRQTLVTERELRRQGEITNKELRALSIRQLSEITRLNMQVDTLLKNVHHNGEIINVLNSQLANIDTTQNVNYKKAILLPFGFEKHDEFLTLKGNFDKDGILDIDLKLPLPVSVYIDSKTPNSPKCIVTTPNPYIGLVNVTSYAMSPQRKKLYGIGLQVGYGLILKKEPQLAPYVGIGVSRNIIRF
jgi:hypothetical protein